MKMSFPMIVILKSAD